ncbi:DUF1289 domain-containing protein [Noviherbaspirillum galbum]|nr:DUF1289 domain-containing protein [Noviherbaspirillum galbum]
MTRIPFPPEEGGTVPSPCINVCRMNPQTGLCEGCWRTIDEIVMWGTADNDKKKAVWAEIERRQQALF